jgi:RNA polymerase sigma factor (sigma-70 family)
MDRALQPDRGNDRVKTDVDVRAVPRRRPTTDETFAAAIDLVTRGSSRFKRFALRYSLCAADAEDAYQRSLEILLRKAPTADRGELRAWLHTVIKHEALALRRQRERALAGTGDEPPEQVAEAAPLDEQASGRERVRLTAEALTQLKPSELQCLLLKALGYSYDEIAERTGYSWTKVNRSLTEGRRRFLDRFGELSTGRRCGEFQALLSTACDGEASREEERMLRAHLDGCASCRAALRTYRAAPRQVAELFPPGIVVGLAQQQSWLARLGDWLSLNSGDRAGALAWKVQQGAEAMGAGKAAAVVASTAALAGGTAVHEQRSHHVGGAHRPARVVHAPNAKAAAAAPVPAASPVAAAPATQPKTLPSPTGAREAVAVPAEEFAPAPAPQPEAPAPVTAAGEFGGPAASTSGGGGGEFGP